MPALRNRSSPLSAMSGPEPRRMIRLFVAPEQIADDAVRITGSDHLHIARVLRAQPGQPLAVLDNRGNAYRARLVAVDKVESLARIEGPAASAPESSLKITVAQALGKGDKFEQVIQHGTEIGAAAFVPIRAERSVADVPAAKVAERLARWRQIAKGAAEQAERTLIPEVSGPLRFMEYLSAQADGYSVLLLHPSPDSIPLSVALRRLDLKGEGCSLILLIGPEGGWSLAELSSHASLPDAARPMAVTLGPRVLRTEIAALAAISQILYHMELI